MHEILPSRLPFYRYLDYEIKADALLEYIIADPELERILGADVWLDLVSFDFESRDLRPHILKWVHEYFEWSEFEYWRTVKLLSDIVAGKMEIVLASRKLRELYLDQEKTGRRLLSLNLAIGFEACIGDCPIESEYHLWNEKALESELEIVAAYRNDLVVIAEKELNTLQQLDLRKWVLMEERIFQGLINRNDGFDAPMIRYFSGTDFRILLDRAEEFGLQIFGIEPWFDRAYFDCAGYKEYSDDPADSSWYNRAFEEFKARQEGLLYAASYGFYS